MYPRVAKPDHLSSILVPDFIGRDREVAETVRLLAQPPALVLLEGEAGIGKSRFVQEVRARLRGDHRTMPVALCPPFQELLTLGPIVEALRRAADDVSALQLSPLAGALRPLLPEWADALPPALDPADDAKAARYRLFRALAELLGRLGVQTLVVEDAHWADEVTLDFLLFLIARLPEAPNLMVTCRPDDLPPTSSVRQLCFRMPPGSQQVRVTLEALDVDQTAQMVSSMLAGARVTGEFAKFLHTRTEGVPLALEELVRLMQSRADITKRDGAWVRRHLENIEVPPSIRDAVLERTSRLGIDAQVVLQSAAVLMDPSDQDTLIAVTGLPADRASLSLAETLGSGLLDQDDQNLVGFRHVLNAHAVYDSIPAPLRRSLHLQAGVALEARTPLPVSRLALHFREAGETARWLHYAEQATDLALSTGDETSAGNLVYELLSRASLPAQTVVRLIDKIPVPAFAGRFERLADVLRALLTSGLADPKVEAELRAQLGHMLMLVEEYKEGRAHLERAIPGLDHDPVRAARAMLTLGWPRGRSATADSHRGWLDRASQQAAGMKPADRLRVTVERAVALLKLGDPAGWDEANQIPDEAASSQEWQEIARGCVNMASSAVHWGRYRDAEKWVRRAVEVCERRDYGFAQAFLAVTQLHLDFFVGQWQDIPARAKSLAESAYVQQISKLEAILVSGLFHAANGAYSTAEKLLGLVVGGSRDHDGIEEAIEAAAALGQLSLGQGDVDHALEVTDEPIRVVAHKGIWLWATEVGPTRTQALVAAGRHAEAAELVAGFAAGLGNVDAPAAQCGLAMAQAILTESTGDHDRAVGEYTAAAAAWMQIPRPLDALIARERQARCLLASGDRDQAIDLLSTTLQGLSQLGARGAATRVMKTLEAQGVDVVRPWRGGRKGYGDQLSPRELDVTRLVIDGRTNREIAEALFLSPKTVGRHLNSAMRKLNVTTRTALAVRVVEAGLIDHPGTDTRPR